jgi:transposase-like protein
MRQIASAGGRTGLHVTGPHTQVTSVGSLDDATVEIIVERVVAALRDELPELARTMAGAAASTQLTVADVAERLGVARSTVYAHWREWGGYKLGPGERAPIRFDESRLQGPSPAKVGGPSAHAEFRRPRGRRRRGELLQGNPRIEPLRTERHEARRAVRAALSSDMPSRAGWRGHKEAADRRRDMHRSPWGRAMKSGVGEEPTRSNTSMACRPQIGEGP